MASVPQSLGALIPLPARSVPIIQKPQVEAQPHGLTIGELCHRFLHHKRTMVSIGELSARTLEHYKRSAAALLNQFGDSAAIANLLPEDFLALRAQFAKNCGPHRLANSIQSVRSVFKYGFDCGMLERPMCFGPGFKKPSAKLFRRARREGGIKMFEAAELRAIIEAAQPRVRPMILLGINCGLGNTDCGKLLFGHLDFENGILDYPRPKTECDRRAFLWPETIAAIKRAITLRNASASPELEQIVFLTSRGNCWCDGRGASTLGKEFDKTVIKAGLEPRKRAFYTLRRTFRTIADEVGDQPAAMFVMGHIPPADDMSAVYRQRICDDRLRIVADYVRGWLYPCDKDNYLEAYQREAAAITKGRERLCAQDVFLALRRLKMTQAELARYLGLNAQWISTLVRGREPISNDTDLRLRSFIQELAQGKHPQPLDKKALRPQFEKPSDIPLPDDVKAAMLKRPMLRDDFRVFAEYLMLVGVTRLIPQIVDCLRERNWLAERPELQDQDDVQAVAHAYCWDCNDKRDRKARRPLFVEAVQ